MAPAPKLYLGPFTCKRAAPKYSCGTAVWACADASASAKTPTAAHRSAGEPLRRRAVSARLQSTQDTAKSLYHVRTARLGGRGDAFTVTEQFKKQGRTEKNICESSPNHISLQRTDLSHFSHSFSWELFLVRRDFPGKPGDRASEVEPIMQHTLHSPPSLWQIFKHRAGLSEVLL